MVPQTLEDLLAMGYDKITYWDSLIQEDITDFLKNKKTGICLLDIGCGAGKWDALSSQIFSSDGTNSLIIGLDLSRESISRAKSSNLSGCTDYVVADASRIPFVKETFNAIFVIALLHHLSSYEAIQGVLKEIKRLVKGETCVLIVENTVDNPFKNLLVKNWRTHKSTDLHLEGFTSSMLLSLLEEENFQIIFTKYENLFLVYLCTVLGVLFRITLPSRLIITLNRMERYFVEKGFWRYSATIHLMTKSPPTC
jgi:ubiquinone/menaquinone biosynthesis C-methylase UbiE